MEETEENMSAEDIQTVDSPTSVKIKPKKRSLVERELETNMTARVTSPITSDGSSTSRYGRARKLKSDGDMEAEKIMKPLKIDVSKQPQPNMMHASNSPVKDTSKKSILVGSSIADQIENIYNENISLSRFGSEEKANLQSPAKKSGKVYIRKDLIQKPDMDNVVLIKNLFSPNKPSSHLKNILERSSEKYALNGHGKAFNGLPDTSSVVKTLDFDGKKKKEVKEKVISKNELFEIEAACEYQVGDLAWARVGTYPFWPCIVTRDPFSDMFVKKKLFGRVERSVIHVTFFGDNGRRGWIVDNMLRKYHGRAEFESCRDKFTPESKKKDPRLYAAHFVSDKKLHLWNVSVEEAETLMKEPKRLRIDILYDMLEKTRAVKTTPLKRDTGGKITRTGSDVSLSESLYDTLFSEDDGKADDRSSKRARNKSLDVSEVVTACLDNMAARSGIIQIQRQSHMDRWLQKAKSKTPEKMQPKLYIKEKRKDRMKKKEGKKSRKNESLGSDATLLPYQNEHDYSSVNYENHNINDSSNKNIDSASGLDSTLNSSDIGVVVKIESLSSSMEDSSQYDIITTVVNDDIIMTDPENVPKEDNSRNESNHNDNFSDNNNVHESANNDAKENELVKIKDELPENTGELKNSVQPRRSKRKRQTLEGLNNSITENKAKEPKLDLTETCVDPMPNCVPKCDNTEENIETNHGTLTVTNAETPQSSKSVEVTSLSCNSESVLVSKPQVVKAKESPEDNEVAVPPQTNIEQETLQSSNTKSNDLIPSSSVSTPVVDIPPLENKEDTNKYLDNSDGNNLHSVTTAEKETPLNSSFQSSGLLVSGNFDPVVVIEPLKNKLETEEYPENALTNFSTRTRAKTEEKETVRESKRKSNRLLSLSSNSKLELLEKTLERKSTGREMKNAKEYCTATTVPNLEEEPSQNDTITSNEFIPSSSLSTPVVEIPPLENKEDTNKYPDNSDGNNLPSVTTAEKETPLNSSFQSSELLVSGNFDPVVVIEPLKNKLETEEDPENALTNFSTQTRAKTEEKETVRNSKRKSNRLLSLSSNSKLELLEKTLERKSTGREMKNTKEYCTATTVPISEEEPSQYDTITPNEFISLGSNTKPIVVIEPLDMNGLDTQIIIRGCKQLVSNKFLDSPINLKTSANRLSQNNMVSKETNSIDEQGADVNDVLKDCHPKTKEDVCVSVVDKEKTNTTDSTDLVADAISDPVKVTEPKKSLFDEIRNTNGLTKVVIGDELYIFDRTLSQDYDEIDGDRSDEVTSSIISENLGFIDTEDDNVVRADSSSHKETLQNSTEDNTETIEFKTQETVLSSKSADLSSKTDCGSLSTPTNDKIIADLFENNSDVQSDTSFDIGNLQKETDKDSSIASNVSSEVFDERNEVSNEVAEENNDRCVFLDQRLKIPNAQSADGIKKKTKPRFRLNRTRHCSLKLKLNIGKVLEMKESSLDKGKSGHVQKTKSTNCNSNENCKSKRGKFSKETEDSKKTMRNPEFLKYMEIRKDALLDDQPDLSQDEIVTYLYKQWVYEEGNKSDVNKIDDKVRFKLVEDVHQKQLSQAKKESPTLENYFIKVDTHPEKNNLETPLSRPDDRVSSVTKNTKYSNVTMNTEDTNKFEEDINSELPFQINCIDKIARRSLRRSKEKQPQEMTDLEKKSVLETVPKYDISTSAEEKQSTSKTPEEEFKEKIDPEKCTQETVGTDSTTKTLNSNELFITEHEVSAEQINGSKKVMHAPEFIKYMEIHQDALLDEQSDLTQDEIVTYLHQKWLYEEGNKSDAKKIYDKEQSHLVKDCNEKPAPSAKKILLTLKKCFKKVITDEENGISGKVALTTTEVPVTEDSKEKLDTEKTINDAEKTDVEKCVTDTVSLNSNNRTFVLTRRASRRSKDKQVTKKIINDSIERTNPEKPTEEVVSVKCNAKATSSKEKKEDENIIQNKFEKSHKKKTDPENLPAETVATGANSSQMLVTKQIELSKEKQDTRNTTSNPEFIKYLEIHQDALLDEQPDLTLDEIETYLYQKWIYEENNKSDMKKLDDSEQSNLVKGIKQEPLPQQKKLKKNPKVELAPVFKSVDIRDMIQKNTLKLVNHANDIQLNSIDASTPTKPSETEKSNSLEEKHTSIPVNNSSDNDETHKKPKNNAESQINKGLCDTVPKEERRSSFKNSSKKEGNNEGNHQVQEAGYSAHPMTLTATANLERPVVIDWEACIDDLGQKKDESKSSTDSVQSKIINGFIEFEVNQPVTKTEVIDPVMVSVKTEDSGISTGRKIRKEKDIKKSMDDPEFIKYLEARQDALIDEQPDLTQEEIVTYLYQTWFYEESTKSDVKKSDETEQSNLVKGLNQDPVPQPRKYKKKPKVEKENIEIPKAEKALKTADIRDMVHKPKRKITQSKPYYNEDDSDLEEEDLETFKIFDRDEQNEQGEEIDEVELYFEQLTKPKPNVFKGYVRERVCEICYRAGNIVKCKSCHGMFHVECVKKETEVTETTAPNNRGRKKKRGRKPKNYDPSLDSQSDERSQDANNSEELNISLEEESESHIVIDADNFETLWENKLKEITEIEDEYDSDQEVNWEVEPGHCEIVGLKQKEKPIDYSDYKCSNCLKYETPVCFVCQSNKSPKGDTEVRQKCQVAHCHRYYHLECLDHWPQTQFNSWEPSKTNKKQIEYIEALSCPRHVCHTCVSDDPRGCKTRFSGDKLARCVKCPATYHSFTKCLPAGTQILTGSQIICPRHYEHRPGKVPCHVNTGWCFICALGGTLICCEYCPTSFHAECLNIKPPEGSYMCEDCETGRLPVYGEMVWVKLGHYRWWPGIVLHPTEIPDNIWAVKHSPGEFVVRFFGQYDHYWVNRGRVFPFQEGDSGRISSQKSKIDAAFTMAMEHAQRACAILKKMEPNEEEDLDIASSLLPPHYVKLKVNKPAGNVARKDMDANSLTQCDCNPGDPDPCGPYTHCLNRMLLTECGPLCRAGERCNNRAFEKRLYPKLQAYRTPHRGWGLRTLEDIKQGQFVIEYVGELIDLEEFRRRMCRKHEIRDENFYFLALDNERMIDAGPKGNLARFMNHCCEPNCETQKWTVLGDVRVGLFALRDIPANSEVTFNYHLECAGIEKKRCLCGARRCSGYIGAKPKQLLEDQAKKTKLPTKRTYKKRKPVEEPSPSTSKPRVPKIKIKLIKPKELTEIEKDVLIIKNATNGLSSDSEVSLNVEDKNIKALSLKRKRVSFSTEEVGGKKAKLETEYVIEA